MVEAVVAASIRSRVWQTVQRSATRAFPSNMAPMLAVTPITASDEELATIKFDANGLVTTVVQDIVTKGVLMVAWMNADALRLTLETGQTHFWSRSRQELWHKGATSGHTQTVTGIWADCDADVLLVQVEPAGPACHTGAVSCFFRRLEDILD